MNTVENKHWQATHRWHYKQLKIKITANFFLMISIFPFLNVWLLGHSHKLNYDAPVLVLWNYSIMKVQCYEKVMRKYQNLRAQRKKSLKPTIMICDVILLQL